jgi:hypothetical protein
MIIGEYPCCGGTLALDEGDGRGRYAPHACVHCGASVWTRFSKVAPETWTDEAFRLEFVLDDQARTVVPRQ